MGHRVLITHIPALLAAETAVYLICPFVLPIPCATVPCVPVYQILTVSLFIINHSVTRPH